MEAIGTCQDPPVFLRMKTKDEVKVVPIKSEKTGKYHKKVKVPFNQ